MRGLPLGAGSLLNAKPHEFGSIERANQHPSAEPGHWHNRTMILSAGDLALEIDFGRNQPAAILQRKVKGDWKGFLVDGKPVVNPVDVEILPPGWYRLRE